MLFLGRKRESSKYLMINRKKSSNIPDPRPRKHLRGQLSRKMLPGRLRGGDLGLRFLLFAILLSISIKTVFAASLDVGTSYQMKALSFSNLNLQYPPNNHSFILQNARLSAFVKDIRIPMGNYEDQTMDVGLALRGIGVTGSSMTVQSAPFSQIAAQYPSVNFTPFIEDAYIRLKQFLGQPVEATFGQQPFTLGSGLLLADDGMGMPGVSVLGGLPWWNMKAGGFIFQPRNPSGSPNFLPAATNSLMVYGLSLELPTEGVWQLHEMVEKDQTPQTLESGIPISAAKRYFTSIRYQMNYGPFVFDGEAAMERGSASPAGPSPADPGATQVQFNGNAQVLKAKWRQTFWKGGGEGIARMVFARGSGYKGSSATTDEAFFPSHGHRFEGLERSGFGDFFGANPYSAFGGQSTVTASGIRPGVSGIQTVGLGMTPPALYGAALDIDYFLYQADRNTNGPFRTLGSEYDFRLRYSVHDKFLVQTGFALFRAGSAINPSGATARRWSFEVSGRF